MILITGSTGFVGMHLLQTLSKTNIKIVALYRSKEKKEITEIFLKKTKSIYKNIIWKRSDINDIIGLEDAFKDITHVYHCAGLISFSFSDKQRLNNINIGGTKNIVNLCIEKKISKLIYLSSISALGEESNEDNITTKFNNYNHKTPYAYSKYNAELEVWRGIEEGLKSVIINPGVIMGESILNNSPESKLKKMINQFPFFFYTKGRSGFVNINDVIKVSISLMNSQISNERFIIVAKNYSYKLILEKLKKDLKTKKKLVRINKPVLNLILYFDTLTSFFGLKKKYMSSSLVESFFSQKKYNGNKIIKFLPNFNYMKI